MADVQRLNSFVKVFDKPFDVKFAFGNAQDEVVGVRATTYRRARIERRLEIFGRRAKNQIARVHVKQVVNDFETTYVQADDTIFRVVARTQKQNRFTIKRVAIVQPRQLIQFAPDNRQNSFGFQGKSTPSVSFASINFDFQRIQRKKINPFKSKGLRRKFLVTSAPSRQSFGLRRVINFFEQSFLAKFTALTGLRVVKIF